jgi:hypothetical protein
MQKIELKMRLADTVRKKLTASIVKRVQLSEKNELEILDRFSTHPASSFEHEQL